MLTRWLVSHGTGAVPPERFVCMYLLFSGDQVSVSPQRCRSTARLTCRRGVQKPLAYPETITVAMPLHKPFTAFQTQESKKYFGLNSITQGCKPFLLLATFFLQQVLEAEMSILFIFIQNRAIYNLIITSIYNYQKTVTCPCNI